MIDYAVGDVVVCINDKKMPRSPQPGVKKGRFYKVNAIVPDGSDGWPFVSVEGVAIVVTRHAEYWLCGSRFKKLPKADPGFIALIKAKKQPKKQLEPAG